MVASVAVAVFISISMTTQENNEVTDVLIEKPLALRIGDREFLIAPPSLGKTLLLKRYQHLLDFNRELIPIDPAAAIMDVCHRKEDEVCQLIAVLLTSDREKLQNDIYITKLAQFVKEHTQLAERAVILQLFIEEKPIFYYMSLLGIDKEKDRFKKASKAKDKGNMLVFGGVSMFGSIIDSACERYGWTYEYVVWGISYNALQLLLADAPQTLYMTEEELANAHISTDGIVLNGDDPNAINMFQELIKE